MFVSLMFTDIALYRGIRKHNVHHVIQYYIVLSYYAQYVSDCLIVCQGLPRVFTEAVFTALSVAYN